MTDNLPPLLPCPFCGGDARNDAHADDCYFILHKAMVNAPNADLSMVPNVLKAWNRRAALAQAQSLTDGWKLVPVEPTEAMYAAGDDAVAECNRNKCAPAGDVYRAMLAASTAQPVQPSERTALEQYDLEQSPDYRKGWDDGRLYGYKVGYRHGTEAHLFAQAKPEQAAQQWMPIETVPTGATGYAWMMLAWGPEQDQSTGVGMRDGEKFYASATFYCLGRDKQYEFREIEVRPTHWMPIPAAPQPKD